MFTKTRLAALAVAALAAASTVTAAPAHTIVHQSYLKPLKVSPGRKVSISTDFVVKDWGALTTLPLALSLDGSLPWPIVRRLEPEVEVANNKNLTAHKQVLRSSVKPHVRIKPNVTSNGNFVIYRIPKNNLKLNTKYTATYYVGVGKNVPLGTQLEFTTFVNTDLKLLTAFVGR